MGREIPKEKELVPAQPPGNTKWILFLDADEYLTEAFKNELRQALERDDKVGYWLSYTIYFLGKQLKGGYPLRKLALFKVGAGEYERIDEEQWSKLDMEVHEHPILTGDVGVIKSKIDHQDFRGVSHYVIKHNEYASWEAGRFIKTINTPNVSDNWTWKQRLKYRLDAHSTDWACIFLRELLFIGRLQRWRTWLGICCLENVLFHPGIL